MFFFVNLIVLLHGYFTGVAASNCFVSVKDVCNDELPEIPNLSSRHPEFGMTQETSHWTFCDVFAINTSQWYKSETLMSTNCPNMYMCGAKFPIWLNDMNPGPDEGVVNRTACQRDFDTCCLVSYDLTAANCGSFMAYCFVNLPSSCNQRYCFDKEQVSTITDPQLLTTNYMNTSVSANSTTLKYSSTTLGDSTTKSSTTTNADATTLKHSITTTLRKRSTKSSVGFKDTSTSAKTTSLKYSSVHTAHDSNTESSIVTSSNVDTTSSKYLKTSTPHDRTTNSSAGVIDTSTIAASPDDHNLLAIALSVIGLMAAVICGLLIFIIRKRRVSKVEEETRKSNEYTTLKFPGVNTSKVDEIESEYRIVTFDYPGVTAEVESKIGVFHDGIQSHKTCFTNADYQLTSTEKELYNEDEHYVTLP